MGTLREHKQAVHNNHLGSTTLLTDASGNVVENSFYSPFAETLGGGTKSRFGYEAKEYDNAVQDIDFHFRKYKPQWGKFTQPDTLIQNVYDPQTLNRYAFERNNPYKYTDPTGHWWQDKLAQILAPIPLWVWENILWPAAEYFWEDILVGGGTLVKEKVEEKWDEAKEKQKELEDKRKKAEEDKLILSNEQAKEIPNTISAASPGNQIILDNQQQQASPQKEVKIDTGTTKSSSGRSSSSGGGSVAKNDDGIKTESQQKQFTRNLVDVFSSLRSRGWKAGKS